MKKKLSNKRKGNKATFTVIDLFSGIGGFSDGFAQARFKRRLVYELKLLVDKDLEAAYTFKRNNPSVPFWVMDVEKINSKSLLGHAKIEDVDIVIGGPPCQGFSSAGKRLFADPRNALLGVFVKIIKELKPKAILLENVPNVFNGSHGKYGEELLENLNRAGYVSAAQVLHSESYGVPQKRRRVFVLALRKDLGIRTPEFPKPSMVSVTVEQAIGDLPSLKAGQGHDPMQYAMHPQNDYQKKRRVKSVLLFNHLAPNHSKDLVKKISIIPEGGANRHLPSQKRFSDNYYSQAYARLHRDEFAYTITGSFLNPGSGRFIHYRDVRALTIREAARLQSFDDNFVFHGTMTAQERHVGNAVPPILAKALAEHLAKILKSAGC